MALKTKLRLLTIDHMDPFWTECAEELRGRSKEKVLEQANKESKPGSIRTGRKGQMRKHRERRSLIFGYEWNDKEEN